jgi:hypothetical protein
MHILSCFLANFSTNKKSENRMKPACGPIVLLCSQITVHLWAADRIKTTFCQKCLLSQHFCRELGERIAVYWGVSMRKNRGDVTCCHLLPNQRYTFLKQVENYFEWNQTSVDLYKSIICIISYFNLL